MKALVIYGTRYGNTQRIAEAIGDGLKPAFAVEVLPIDGVSPAQVTAADLLVIGGPTEAHGITPALKAFVDGMSFALDGKPVAAFDTRVGIARIFSGSAAAGIEAHMRRAGARVIAGEGSFIVKGKQPELEPGELDRAQAWGRDLAARIRSLATVPAR